ncbi:MAG: preprotein translocase subunit SecA [Puniceicoccales bacterium]|jgi:preprotein translocase subunit SecA|nr:preprotein translocase subunit SecA [Puniceicoccales bacterium]
MIGKFLKLFSGRHYKKFLKKCQPKIKAIYSFESEFQKLSEAQLYDKTAEFMERYQNGQSLDNLLPEAFALVKEGARRLYGQTIEVCGHDLIWNMIHYDVQLIGGIALHENRIAEMATGEGKTLVATLPLYLNALTGRNCQLATVNDYLARRDSEWMGYLYNLLGLSVGCIQSGMSSGERHEQYSCNITYGTSSEFGFDYLRDNGLASSLEEQVQKDHYFCIVDEIDSILIDEARTPLIISGPSFEDTEAPYMEIRLHVERLVNVQQTLCNKLIDEARDLLVTNPQNEDAYKKLWKARQGMPKNRQLLRLLENGSYAKKLDKFDLEIGADINRELRTELKEELYFAIDERGHQVDLSEIGRNTLYPEDPDAFVLPDLPAIYSEIDGNHSLQADEKLKRKQAAEAIFVDKSEKIHCLNQLLRAYSLYNRDEEYVIQDGKVIIVDENTGRAMPGRRWSEGLHQAVEAKEGVKVEKESKTYATITIQNYFRMYEKLAGMTGTAETESQEFFDIYKLNVMAIPTNCPCQRIDHNDLIYKTRREKYGAVVETIKKAHQCRQPVLVGTASVEASELLSRMLKREKIKHTVLNAKFHEKEAEIIAQAGQLGSVTISTNMAGRGTDIRLGEGVAELGGLFVIGTERHESRRVDRQLRGRCARQGDPGVSRFFVSLEDNLMRLFAGTGPIASLLDRNFDEGDVLEHPWLNRSIENAQKKVEAYNYSVRRRLLQYDDVLNKQREIIYGMRNQILAADNIRALLFSLIEDEVYAQLASCLLGNKDRFGDSPNFDSVISSFNIYFPIALKREDLEQFDDVQEATNFVIEKIKSAYSIKLDVEDSDFLGDMEQYVMLNAIDHNWQDHLTEMEELRRSVGLRGYGQKDPLNEYKHEAFSFFETLISQIRREICSKIFRIASSDHSLGLMIENLLEDEDLLGREEKNSRGHKKNDDKLINLSFDHDDE